MTEILANNNKKYLQETINNEDKLSSLPDILLGNIISRLPLRFAVATSILSHRWRFLWTRFVTHLIFTNNSVVSKLGSPQFPPTFSGFMSFIAHIIRQITSPCLQIFDLSIHRPIEDDKISIPLLPSWLSQVCTRNPTVFHISTDFWEFRPLVPLPTFIFECSSLEELKLSGHFDFRLRADQIVLPNLKKLDINLPSFDYGFLSTLVLLLNCSSRLEDLSLALHCSVDNFAIQLSAPNLKYCDVALLGRVSQLRSIFVIDAPRLIGISLGGNLAFYCFVNQPCRLQNAIFRFGGEANDHLNMLLGLIYGISSVEYLSLSYNLAMFNCFRNIGANARPIFHNLTRLILNKVSREVMNQRVPIPVCMLRNLKYAELFEIDGDDDDIKLMKCILRNAIVLEDFYVSVDNLDDYRTKNGEKNQLWMEYMFCRELFDYPKRSSVCKIKFEGFYITRVSSEDDNEGIITCKLNYLGRKLGGGYSYESD